LEKYDRYGPTVGGGERMSDKVRSADTYSVVKLDSDVSSLSYTQNRVLLDFTYDF